MTSASSTAGWYPDPQGRTVQRYWTGADWSCWLFDGLAVQRDSAGSETAMPAAPIGKPPTAARTAPTNWPALVVAAGLAIGAFMPWVQADGFVHLTRNGINGGGDGWIYVGLAALVVFYAFSKGKGWHAVMLFLGGAGAVLAAWEYTHVRNAIADANDTSSLISATVGSGVYVCGIASMALLVLGCVHALR